MRKKKGCSVVEMECASLAMDLAMEGIGKRYLIVFLHKGENNDKMR